MGQKKPSSDTLRGGFLWRLAFRSCDEEKTLGRYPFNSLRRESG